MKSYDFVGSFTENNNVEPRRNFTTASSAIYIFLQLTSVTTFLQLSMADVGTILDAILLPDATVMMCIGQDRPVTVHRLVVKDSIEEQIVALHKEKRDLADSLLEGTDSAGKVSAKELLGLLRGE